MNGVYRRIKKEMAFQPGDHIRMGQQVLRLDDITEIAQGKAKDQTWLQGSLNEKGTHRLVQLLPDNSIGEARILHHNTTIIGREVGNILFPEDGLSPVNTAKLKARRRGSQSKIWAAQWHLSQGFVNKLNLSTGFYFDW